jgi:hypothetical protein
MGVVSAQLGQLVDKKLYNRGILTGFNEAFVIDRHTRDRLIADDPNCAEIIKPLVIGKDIKRYRIEYQERYLIFTRHGIDLTRYEAIEQHLLPYKDQLEPKPTDWDDNVKGDWPGRKPGTYKWYEIQDSIAYYEEFEKPKIIFPDIAFSCTFAYDVEGFYSTNTTYFIPIDAEQKYLVPLLNSSLVEFFFRTKPALLRGDYLRFFTQYVTQIPIHRITFTTPADERNTLANEGIALYNEGKHEELLAFTEACLVHQPEQSDVIHDLLVYLAEQMIELKRERQEKLDDFLFDLKGTISGNEFRKLTRLWTPPDTSKKDDVNAQSKLAEAEKIIGSLAQRQLDLHDDIGFLNEEQWIWLLLRRLGKIYSLADVVKVFRRRQPAIATLDKRITTTDGLINAIVYRLYGLTAEEVAVVEGTLN